MWMDSKKTSSERKINFFESIHRRIGTMECVYSYVNGLEKSRVLREKWTFRVYSQANRHSPVRLFECEWTQKRWVRKEKKGFLEPIHTWMASVQRGYSFVNRLKIILKITKLPVCFQKKHVVFAFQYKRCWAIINSQKRYRVAVKNLNQTSAVEYLAKSFIWRAHPSCECSLSSPVFNVWMPLVEQKKELEKVDEWKAVKKKKGTLTLKNFTRIIIVSQLQQLRDHVFYCKEKKICNRISQNVWQWFGDRVPINGIHYEGKEAIVSKQVAGKRKSVKCRLLLEDQNSAQKKFWGGGKVQLYIGMVGEGKKKSSENCFFELNLPAFFLMLCKLSRVLKSHPTFLAAKRESPCMFVHVILKIRLRSKHLGTKGALYVPFESLPWSFAKLGRKDILMTLQAALTCKACLAVFANKRSLACMITSDVLSQFRRSSVHFNTLITFMFAGAWFCMQTKMFCQ